MKYKHADEGAEPWPQPSKPLRKLELGSGHRGTRNYIHHDAYPFPGIDITCDPWELPYADGELDEVLALGFIEHLTYFQALDTFREIHRVLKSGGEFVFDVPDYSRWAQWYVDNLRIMSGAANHGHLMQPPVDLDWCRRTLFGWQRWPGDEHKYGWDGDYLVEALRGSGFTTDLSVSHDGKFMLRRGLYRKRFTNPDDAHLYVVATK